MRYTFNSRYFQVERTCIIRLYDRICYTRINICVMDVLRENIYFNVSGHFDIAKLTVLVLNGGIFIPGMASLGNFTQYLYICTVRVI